jgi:hypothetical protein
MTKSRANFKYPTEAFGRIPSFNNIEEEAEFWDTHDVSEFVGVEFHPVEERDEAESNDRLIVPLASADREELAREAEKQGVPPATLVRLWIQERLKHKAS